MRTHLASTALIGIALTAAGCGGHTASRDFGALPSSPAPASPAAPPVVVAEPAPSKDAATAPAPAVVPAPTADAAAKKLARTEKLNRKLRHQRKLDQHKLAHQHAVVVKVRKQAAAREQRLRDRLAAAQPATPAHARHNHTARPKAPITASDVPIDEAQRGARVSVVRFHDLLNAHDGSACGLLSVRFLHDHFPGDDTAAQRASCASGVSSLSSPVSVLVHSSGAENGGVWVKVVSRF